MKTAMCFAGSVYLHAAAQTSALDLTPPALTGNPTMKTRETQASWMRTREYQTVKEGFTQMEKPGCHIDCNLDVTRIPGRYKDSDQWEEEREQAAVIIQKYVRRSICVRYANLMRRHAKERAEVVLHCHLPLLMHHPIPILLLVETTIL